NRRLGVRFPPGLPAFDMTEEIKLQEVGTADQVKLGLSVAAVIAGVVGYYLLGSDATWLRWVVVAAGLVVAALLVAFSYYGSEFNQFVTRSEEHTSELQS